MGGYNPFGLADNSQAEILKKYFPLLIRDQERAAQENQLQQAQAQPMQSGQAPVSPPTFNPGDIGGGGFQMAGGAPIALPDQGTRTAQQTVDATANVAPPSAPPVDLNQIRGQVQPPPTEAKPAEGQGSQTGVLNIPQTAGPNFTPVPPEMKPSQTPAPQPQSYQTPQEYQDAVKNYIEAIKAEAATYKQMQEQHPSLFRRIVGDVLGIGAGVVTANPNLGKWISGQINTVGTPQRKAEELAQHNVASAQKILEAESGVTKTGLDFQKAGYEAIRAQAEAAKSNFEISPEAFRQKLQLAQAQHEKYIQLEGIDANGKQHALMWDVQQGQLIDPTTRQPPAQGQYVTVRDVPTVRQEMVGQQQASNIAQRGEIQKVITGMKIKEAIDAIGLKGDEAIKVGNALEDRKHIDRLSEIAARGAENLKTAQARAMQPTATLRTMAANAQVALDQIPDLKTQINSLASSLGPAKGRWNEFYVNKVGGDNGPFAKLDEALTLFASSLAVAHYGTRGTSLTAHMMQQFREAQSPDDLMNRLDASERILEDRAKYAGIPELQRGAGNVKPPGGTEPKIVPADRVWDAQKGQFVDVPKKKEQ